MAMTSLYNWKRVDPAWEPPAPVDTNAPVPDGTRCLAEIARCAFIQGDKVVTWRIISGAFNNHEYAFRIKKDKPMRLGVLLNALVRDRGQRVEIVTATDAKIWEKLLNGKTATVTIGLYQGHNFVSKIEK